jgi:hypothetical protein
MTLENSVSYDVKIWRVSTWVANYDKPTNDLVYGNIVKSGKNFLVNKTSFMVLKSKCQLKSEYLS